MSNVYGIDLFWEAYSNGLKKVQGIQDELQEKTIEVLSEQKAWLENSVDALKKMEENDVKQESSGEKEQLLTPFHNVQKMSENVQEYALKRGQVVLDNLIEAQNELHNTTKEILDTHKKGRTEYFKLTERFIEQVKTAQKQMLSPSRT